MNRITMPIVGAAVIATLLLLLTVTGSVPGWLAVLLTSCLAPAIGLVIIKTRQPEQLPPRIEYVPTPAPPTIQIQGAPLPSADPDYRFLLSCVACWRPRAGGPTPLQHPEELARLTVIARASQLTATEQPGTYELLRHRLDGALATPMPDRTGAIEIWAHSISLTLPNDDLQRQHELAAIRKDEQTWEHRRNYERNVRTYLTKEVLADTGSTVVWWLAQDPKKVRETVDMIETLAQLSAAAMNRNGNLAFRSLIDESDSVGVPADESPAERAARSVHNLADSLFLPGTEAERSRFADQLARLINLYGGSALSARIRADFNAPDLGDPARDGNGVSRTSGAETHTEQTTGRHFVSGREGPPTVAAGDHRQPDEFWPTGD